MSIGIKRAYIPHIAVNYWVIIGAILHSTNNIGTLEHNIASILRQYLFHRQIFLDIAPMIRQYCEIL
jgi:hypothetical protein